MKHIPNKYDAYLNHWVSFHSCGALEEPVRINTRFFRTRPSAIRNEIFQSLEGMSSGESIEAITKEIRDYVTNADIALTKYVDAYKKLMLLLRDSIPPLMGVHDAFENLYGIDVVDTLIKRVKVTYFRNNHTSVSGQDGSLQFYLVESLASALLSSLTKAREIATTLLHGVVDGNNRLSVDDAYISELTAIPKTAVEIPELGYPTDYLKRGLERLTSTGEHITLYNSLHVLQGNFGKLKTSIEKELPGLKGDDPNKSATEINHLLEAYNTCNITFGTLLKLIHAVTFAAYQSLYNLHTAEIEYNKTQR